ncbi:hypothetical protein [Prosthecobacter fusiformis]|nr:hypothetical protein [Prosthecobacter fusiformis]
MSTVRISCFGILLKHHLLRHYEDTVAPKRRMRPDIEMALASLPADFQISAEMPPVMPSSAGGEEQHITLQIDVKSDQGHNGPFRLDVQGILARRASTQEVHLMPFGMALVADSCITLVQLHQVLRKLGQQTLRATAHRQIRIGSLHFQPQTPRNLPTHHPLYPSRHQTGLHGQRGRLARNELAATA